MSKPTVVLADDHAVLLEGLRRLLEPEYHVVATAADGRALLECVARKKPDIAVVDVGMPSLNGIEAARQLRELYPDLRIVILSQQSDRAYAAEAFRIGVSAYVLKQSAATELLAALAAALDGGYYASRSLMSTDAVSRFDPKLNPSELFGGAVTPRQREVLQLVAEGKTAKEIAVVLKISVKTVEFHKAAIMEELGLKTTAALTRYAVEHGIIH